MPPKAPPPFVVNKKLILHFDIGNALVLTGKIPKEEMVQR
jgi:hypothetical protein